MDLFVRTVTLLEANDEPGRFPKRLRQLLCSAVEGIAIKAMPDLLSKHETDPGNFDGKIEADLRELDPLLTIKANCLISDRTKFNIDLVIDADEALVCVEIEKGYLSRFELDILKMQVFAGSHPGKPVFGAFIVPDDNVVANHISGNPRESSFRYLTRLCRLVAQVQPRYVEDILIVGYSMTPPADETQNNRRRKRGPGPGKPAKTPSNLVLRKKGLLPKDRLKSALRGFPINLVVALRSRLMAACPKLREKLNMKSRYLGYGLTDGSDALFVYVQKKGVLIDIRVSADRADELRRLGFDVRPRNNYQAKAGWLTGLFVPHDTDKLSEVVSLALEALREE